MKIPQVSKKFKFIIGGGIGVMSAIWVPTLIGTSFDVGPAIGIACVVTAICGVLAGFGTVMYGITEL